MNTRFLNDVLFAIMILLLFLVIILMTDLSEPSVWLVEEDCEPPMQRVGLYRELLDNGSLSCDVYEFVSGELVFVEGCS